MKKKKIYDKKEIYEREIKKERITLEGRESVDYYWKWSCNHKR